MEGNHSRRSVLKGIGGAAASAAALGVTGTAAALDTKTRGMGSVDSATGIEFTGVAYETSNRQGALLEDIKFETAETEISDLHFIVDDGTDTYNARDDASFGDVSVTTSYLDEVLLQSNIPVTNGTVSFDQQVFINESSNGPSVLMETDLSVPSTGDYTITTLANPDMGSEFNNAYLVSEGYYDVFVATDRDYFAAFAQRQDWRKQFDDQTAGIEGVTSGSDKSAWHDAYVEGDGELDTVTAKSGDLDLAFELYAGDRTEMTWQTAIGFADNETDAITRAVDSLEADFQQQRRDSAF
jgi:hypothetical protein